MSMARVSSIAGSSDERISSLPTLFHRSFSKRSAFFHLGESCCQGRNRQANELAVRLGPTDTTFRNPRKFP
jgi:hypothetical protein